LLGAMKAVHACAGVGYSPRSRRALLHERWGWSRIVLGPSGCAFGCVVPSRILILCQSKSAFEVERACKQRGPRRAACKHFVRKQGRPATATRLWRSGLCTMRHLLVSVARCATSAQTSFCPTCTKTRRCGQTFACTFLQRVALQYLTPCRPGAMQFQGRCCCLVWPCYRGVLRGKLRAYMLPCAGRRRPGGTGGRIKRLHHVRTGCT
jgi:hypothetical protein